MKKTFYLLSIVFLMTPILLNAQSDNTKSSVKFSGYIQGDYEMGQKEAKLYVGNPNSNEQSYFGRFGIRRGRLKLDYGLKSNPDWSIVGQITMTEKSINPFQLYFNYCHTYSFEDSKLTSLQVGARGGLDSYHFGLEPQEGSKARLAPEYTPYYDVMFPGVDDFMAGGHVTCFFDKASSYKHALGLQMYLLSGNGRNSMRKSIPDLSLDLRHTFHAGIFDAFYGASYYLGYVPQTNLGDKDRVKRNYLSLYARVGMPSCLGQTRLTGEYMSGNQPGKLHLATVTGPSISNKEYNDGKEIFSRGFWGMSLQLDHRFSFAPIGILYKYYYYDKRDILSGDELLWNKYLQYGYASKEADGTEQAHGIGINVFLVNDRLRMTAYYEAITSKRAPNKSFSFYDDPDNDRFTFRVQYNF